MDIPHARACPRRIYSSRHPPYCFLKENLSIQRLVQGIVVTTSATCRFVQAHENGHGASFWSREKSFQ
jgi:hypothetical protein